MALATARNRNIDLLLISEPNKALMEKRTQWLCDDRKDSGIIILNEKIRISERGKGEGYTYIKTSEFTVFSCYSSGNRDLVYLEDMLDEISIHIRSNGGKCIITGDFNCKSPHWGMKKTDARGRQMEGWIAQENLVILNEGDKPTFQSGNYNSVLDLTMVTSDLKTSVLEWDVLEEETLSDHNYIYTSISSIITCVTPDGNREGWLTTKLNAGKVEQKISALTWDGDMLVGRFHSNLREICDQAMPRRKQVRNFKPVYWWNTEIACIRKDCIQKRRTYSRALKRSPLAVTTHLWILLQETRNLLRSKIKSSKKYMWKKLCDEIDRDIWGDGYKILIRSTIGLSPNTRLSLKQMVDAARYFFPPPVVDENNSETVINATRAVILDCDNLNSDNENVIFTEFTHEELERAASKLKNKKAPGPGMIPAEILKLVTTKNPDYVLQIYNHLLRMGIFPTEWKMAKLVLIPKGSNPAEDVTMHRPLCLLDVEGKLFELLIEARLENEIDRTGGLSEHQFGFRKGRQTIDAVGRVLRIAERAEAYTWKHRRICVMITLDVRNAFNSASWHQILGELNKRGIDNNVLRLIDSYLSDRRIILDAGQESRIIEVYRGVPQGSILGPKLWNVFYDELLRLEFPQGVAITGFADDIALSIVAKTEAEIIANGNAALAKVEEWMRSRHLELAPGKSEAVILTHKRKIQPIEFNLMGKIIAPVRAIKYLGVWLDTKMTFSEHINRAAEKAGKTMAMLTRVMPNIGGPRSSKRRVLTSIIHSKILYAAPVWYVAMENKKLKSRLLSVQRLAAIRVSSGYRTISTAAVGVIAGIAPIDLLALERKEKYEGINAVEARRNLICRWQTRWDQEDKGQWTKKLIPNIEDWICRPYGEVDYFLTQALSGHGCYRKYLFERNRADSPECKYCHDIDDVKHTLFDCVRWEEMRDIYERDNGRSFTIQEVREKLTSNEGEWTKISEVMRTIIRRKEMEDR